MKNKNSLLKFGVMVASIITFGLSFSSATLFHLEINTGSRSADEIALMKSEISTKIMPIHFADNGNDFGGFFYFSNGLTGTENNVDKAVEIDGDEPYKCNNLVRGYYYNAERGERLWPLDDDTKNTREILANSQGSLNLNGGLYTVCTTSGYDEALAACGNDNYYDKCIDEVNATYKSDDYGYYGYLVHNYKGQKMALVAGVDYDATGDNKFVTIDSNSKFSPTFIRYLNQNPVGFIYDYNGGIGLVGCKFKRPPDNSVKEVITRIYNFMPVDLTKIFQIVDNKITVTSENNYDQFIDCSDSNAIWSPVLSVIIEGIVGLSDEKKVGYIGNPEDDKMQYFSTANIDNNTLVNYAKKKAEILCRGKWKSNYTTNELNKLSVICIDDRNNNNSAISSLRKGKTYIVKNRDVVITPESSCTETAINDSGYNLLIINGNLKINENGATCVFTGNGFPRGNSTSDFASAVLGSNGEYDLSNGAAVGSYFNGNFIIDGHITGNNNSELKNKYFIYGKITSKDDFGDILSTFSWRCNDGIATDGTYCPSSLYQSASLVVIDRNYDSPLLKS